MRQIAFVLSVLFLSFLVHEDAYAVGRGGLFGEGEAIYHVHEIPDDVRDQFYLPDTADLGFKYKHFAILGQPLYAESRGWFVLYDKSQPDAYFTLLNDVETIEITDAMGVKDPHGLELPFMKRFGGWVWVGLISLSLIVLGQLQERARKKRKA